MAKRKRLEAPSAEHLSALEQSLKSDVRTRNPGVAGPPIAQVAAEAASAAKIASPHDQAKQAQLAAEAERLRQAEEAGLLITELPLSQIDATYITRDRTALEAAAMAELTASIRSAGMRLPIEVCALENGRYGLISGYRRLTAIEEIAREDAEERPLIRALVRPAADQATSLVAMVEENEVRADLTPYERGRIAVIATREGAFDSLESAVNALFGSASKAKRSKIRSFARIFDGLGDLLLFGPHLKERDGLALAMALKEGELEALRAALSASGALTPEAELRALQAALKPPQTQRNPERIRTTEVFNICDGVSLRYRQAGQSHQLCLDGWRVDEELMLRLAAEVEAYLKDQLSD